MEANQNTRKSTVCTCLKPNPVHKVRHTWQFSSISCLPGQKGLVGPAPLAPRVAFTGLPLKIILNIFFKQQIFESVIRSTRNISNYFRRYFHIFEIFKNTLKMPMKIIYF